MSSRRIALVLSLIAVLGLPAARAPRVLAESSDWPHWRGPTGNGVSLDAEPPLQWSTTKGIAWRTALPGSGSASPIVWRNQIFVVAAEPSGEEKANGDEGEAGTGGAERSRRTDQGRSRGRERDQDLVPHKFILMALDRKEGKLLWKKSVVEATPHAGHHPDHGFASGSPCTDGELVFAHFGSRGTFAYTLEGELVWKRTDLGKMETRNGFGEGSSPTVHGKFLVVPWDHQGPSYITALDTKTGKTLWKADRDEPSSWGTPLVVEHDGRVQVVATGENFARGYNLETGEELWRCKGQTARPIASPVAGHGLIFVGSGFQGSFLGAFKADGKGDLAETGGVAWSIAKNTPDVPSPLLSGDRLYFHSGRAGILSCHDAATGKAHYAARRVEGIGNVYASPVGAAGRILVTGRDGVTVVIADGDELKILATNSVGEAVDATPALAGNEVFIRGKEHLFAIRG